MGGRGRGSTLRGWYNLLGLYSRPNLTHESDRLMAISALAKEVNKRTGFEYLAGLWKEMMVEDLLWCVRDAAKPSGWARIPSWSWASLRGGFGLRWPYLEQAGALGRIIYMAGAVSAGVHYPDLPPQHPGHGKKDNYGRVVGGFVRLRTMLRTSSSDVGLAGEYVYDSDMPKTQDPLAEHVCAILIRATAKDDKYVDFGLILEVSHFWREDSDETIAARRLGMFYQTFHGAPGQILARTKDVEIT
jgi:hypothetical protein